MDKIIKEADLPQHYETVLDKMDSDIVDALQSVAVPYKFTPKIKKIIAKQWGENLELYIKGWAENNVITLRETVLANSLYGHRAENLIGLIQDNYGVSKRKAKFLARQETSLLMSKLREERYKSVGVQKYKWSTSHDERVRPMHKRLNGKVINWDSPPITDEKGNRNHAGEDFNCSCVAIPILELD
jgi:SPP1 gp7 family putative phage head morphogenesis protein